MNTLKKIGTFLSLITGIALAIHLYRIFKDVPLSDGDFPGADEKAAAEKDVAELKEELKEVGAKEFSDEEIDKKFN